MDDPEPWDCIDNEEQVFQRFSFNLTGDMECIITLPRLDNTQRGMEAQVNEVIGPDGPSGTRGDSNLVGFAFDHVCGTNTARKSVLITTSVPGVYTIGVGLGMTELSSCPREGSKYSLKIKPAPIGVGSVDYTCDEPPHQRLRIWEGGKYYSLAGAFLRNASLSSTFEYSLLPLKHNGYSQIMTEGSLEINILNEDASIGALTFENNPASVISNT